MKRPIAIVLLGMVAAGVGVLGWKAYDVTAERRVVDRLRQTVPERVLAAAGTPDEHASEPSVRSVIVVFFTTTCEYCRAEIEALKHHAAAFGRSSIVLVSPEDEDTIAQFRLKYRLDDVPQFRVLRDTMPSIGGQFRIRRVPTTLVYGRDGSLAAQYEGVTPVGELLREVAR